jgi:flagellar assembly protein FliH
MSSKILRGAAQPVTEDWLVVADSSRPFEITHGDAMAREDRGQDELIQQQSRQIHQLDGKVASLEAELSMRVDQARQMGFREGETAGHAKAQAALDAALQRLARAAADLAAYRPAYRRESEQEMVRLSLSIARKVLKRELTVDPSALQGVVKAALETLNSSEIYRIRLAASDAAALERHILAMGLPQAVEVVADPSLERGAVLFDTARGQVDAGVQTQLNEIERGFTDLADAR